MLSHNSHTMTYAWLASLRSSQTWFGCAYIPGDYIFIQPWHASDYYIHIPYREYIRALQTNGGLRRFSMSISCVMMFQRENTH